MPALEIVGKVGVNGSTGDVLTIAAPSKGAHTNPFIRIKAMYLSVSAASTVIFKSGSVEIGRAYLGTGNSYALADEVSGILDCEPGATFVINSSAGTIGGNVVYEYVGSG